MMQSFRGNMSIRLGVVVALVALALSAGIYTKHSRATACPASAQPGLVYVGTQGRQILALRFDAHTGELTMIGPVEEGMRSTWLVAHPQLPMLYSVDDQNTEEGSVTAYAVDRGTGALNKVNAVTTGGNGTTYLWLDIPSMTLLGANYSSGSVSSIVVNSDASVGPLTSTVKEAGSGPNRRQASAHAHSVAVDPSGRYALVPDLGADRVFVYGFDRTTHALSPDDAVNPRSFTTSPGSGPRHLAFGMNGQYVYLLTELTAEIMVLRWDASQGHLTLVQSLPTTSQDFQGAKSGAEVAVSHDGRFVYVANRGENALVVYRVSPDSGELSLVQRTPSGGQRPWGFSIDELGKWMLVENQASGTVNVFGIDPVSGMLSGTGQSVDIPAPVSVAFVK